MKIKVMGTEKLRAEIQRLKEEYNNSIPAKVSKDKMEATKVLLCMGKVEVLNKVLCILDSLQQEQSLPSNLDDVVEKYGRDTFVNECMENGACDYHDLSNAFKNGAKWHQEQQDKESGTEWSEQDSLHLANAILCAEKEWGNESCTAKWLKSLPERFNLSTKKERSKDERLRRSLVDYFESFNPEDMWDNEFSFKEVIAYLEK